MSLTELVGLIFTFNIMTFGNGPVMVPLLQTGLVEQRGILTIDQLLYAFTIARVTPGQANIYVAAIGYLLFGLAGALLSTLVIMLPGYLMIPLLHGYERVRTVKLVHGFTRGLTSASVGLIFAATFRIGRQTLISPVAWGVFGLSLALLSLLKWNPLLSIAVASAVGLLLSFWL